jgi:hypothetical protein
VLHLCLFHAVLLVYSEVAALAYYALDVQAVLDDTAAFAKVDAFDAFNATPSVQTLRGYQAALVFADESWANATALGNNMAEYFDAGGNVVLAVFSTSLATNAKEVYNLLGRWKSEGYDLITPAKYIVQKEDQPLKFVEPNSTLVAGMTSLTATAAFQSPGAVSSPDVVVAQWGSGAPLIVRCVRRGRKIVALNFFPVSSRVSPIFWDVTTSGATIMRNALMY